MNEPLKILHVNSVYKPAYQFGGPVLSVSELAEGLAKRGHEVTVFTTNDGIIDDKNFLFNKPIIVDGVTVWYFKFINPEIQALFFLNYFSQSVGFRYIPGFSEIVRRAITNFDIVHTHAVWSYINFAIGRSAINTGKPLFYSQRGAFDPARMKYRWLKKRVYFELFIRPIVRKATRLIALNNAEVGYYNRLKLSTTTEIVSNGVDIKKYYQIPTYDFYGNFPLSFEHFVILFMSRMHVFKGADILVDAFINIAHRFHNAVLVMAGPDEQGITKELQDRANNAGLGKRVFFPGMVSGNIKKNLLARANLFCLPSMGEGFSIAVLEAMASGTAVMLSPECNFPEVVDYHAGMIVERDIKKWAAQLEIVIKEPEIADSMGQKARELVETKYTWEKVIDRLEKLYQEVVTVRS